MMAGYTWLNEAVWGKKPAVLRFGPGESDCMSVRFESERDGDEHEFRVTVTEGTAPALDPMIEGATPVEIAFSTPGARVYFDALPLRRGRKWKSQWAALKWPEQLTVVERRAGSRELIPDDVEIVAALSVPEGGPILRARVWDMDLEGIGCVCPTGPELPAPALDKPCGIMLYHQGIDYQLSGFCKNVQRLSTNSVRVGLKLRSEAELAPDLVARYKQLIHELQALRIRRGFRRELRNTVMFGND